MFKKYVFDSGRPGCRCLILGAVHGNETAGTLAQHEIINRIQSGSLKLKSGKITFIPVVNESARRQDRRFVDVNLNRVICFHPSPQNNEEKIANELIKEIADCDVMLDLHSTHCPKDKAFAFIDYPTADNLRLLSVIPVNEALAGWPAIYEKNKSIDNFCTEKYARTCGKTGLTVECGYHKSPQAVAVAKNSIINVLAYFDNLDLPKPATTAPRITTLDSFAVKTCAGHFCRDYKHLDSVAKGEVIAVGADGKPLTAPADGRIIMPNPDAAEGSEWFYLGH